VWRDFGVFAANFAATFLPQILYAGWLNTHDFRYLVARHPLRL